MAINTTSAILRDGARNLVMQFTGIADGPGQEVNVTKVDVSELSPPAATVAVANIEYSINSGEVDLAWDADVPVIFATLAGQGWLDYAKVTAMQNSAVDANRTGDIVLTTRGFDLDSSYTVKLTMIKKY